MVSLPEIVVIAAVVLFVILGRVAQGRGPRRRMRARSHLADSSVFSSTDTSAPDSSMSHFTGHHSHAHGCDFGSSHGGGDFGSSHGGGDLGGGHCGGGHH